jgi:hypothetical protein
MNLNSVSAISPPFDRQEVIDFRDDWSLLDTNQKEVFHDANNILGVLYKLYHIQQISEISTVTLSSDGQILNVTFWLSGPFLEKPVTSILEYYIRFDVDTDSSTGDENGADYLFDVKWNNETKTWRQIFQEYSNGKPIRLLEDNNNYTNFFSSTDLLVIRYCS